MLTEIDEGRYRDLRYLYGAYVGSLRLLRPTRLAFWVANAPDSTTQVRLRLESFPHPHIARAWGWALRIFWRRFARWMVRALGVPLRQLGSGTIETEIAGLSQADVGV